MYLEHSGEYWTFFDYVDKLASHLFLLKTEFSNIVTPSPVLHFNPTFEYLIRLYRNAPHFILITPNT